MILTLNNPFTCMIINYGCVVRVGLEVRRTVSSKVSPMKIIDR